MGVRVLNSLVCMSGLVSVGLAMPQNAGAAVVVASGVGTYTYSANTVATDPNATSVNVAPFNIGFPTGDRYSLRDNGGFGSPSVSSIEYEFNAPLGSQFTAADVFYRAQSNGGTSFTVTGSYSTDGVTFIPLATNPNVGLTDNGPFTLSVLGATSVTFRVSGSRADGDPGRLSYFGQGDTSNTSPGFVFNSTTSAVPEPASLGLIALTSIATLARRQRSN